jgi:hypothetical protein
MPMIGICLSSCLGSSPNPAYEKKRGLLEPIPAYKKIHPAAGLGEDEDGNVIANRTNCANRANAGNYILELLRNPTTPNCQTVCSE